VGTPGYIDPALIIRHANRKKSSSNLTAIDFFKTDLFSLGSLLYFMITGTSMIGGQNSKESMKTALKFKFSVDSLTPTLQRSLSMECKDLLTTLLKERPRDRPSAYQCLNHPWFRPQQCPLQKKATSFKLVQIHHDNSEPLIEPPLLAKPSLIHAKIVSNNGFKNYKLVSFGNGSQIFCQLKGSFKKGES